MWGIETSDMITCKQGADIKSIIPGNDVTLSDENGQFKSFSLQEKPSSFFVMHAGWVVYEKANFKGKCLYFYDGDCYSNDPENKKGPKLKMWQVLEVGWSLFLKIDLNFMDIKSCVLFTELGRIVVKSLVFYITKSTPRPTHLGGKTMDREEFF